MRSGASNFCKDLGEASELTTNAERNASALCYTVRMQRANREHTLKQMQRMYSVLLACGTNGPHRQRWVNVRCALGVRQTSADEHITNTQHVLCTCLAGVLLACALMHRAPRTFLSDREIRQSIFFL